MHVCVDCWAYEPMWHEYIYIMKRVLALAVRSASQTHISATFCLFVCFAYIDPAYLHHCPLNGFSRSAEHCHAWCQIETKNLCGQNWTFRTEILKSLSLSKTLMCDNIWGWLLVLSGDILTQEIIYNVDISKQEEGFFFLFFSVKLSNKSKKICMTWA